MAIDRAATLRNAEKLLRQGKLDAAIAEYLRLVEDQPRDWNTRQHARRPLRARRSTRQGDRAVHARSPTASTTKGAGAKAAAVYKKILKLKPDHEHALLQVVRNPRRPGPARRRARFT